METAKNIINITVILGFLGSGKTTFLKNFLKCNNKKIAIIINEFGQLNIDGKFFKDSSYSMKEITNGSIFCSCKSDKFLEALEELIDSGYSDIIIESSGLANPISMNKIFNYLKERKKVELKITTIGIGDSSTLYKLVNTNILIKQQIIASNLILLNKIDLATAEEINKSYNSIREYNEDVDIIDCSYCKISLNNLNFKFNKKDFLLNKKILDLKKFILSLDDKNIKDIMNILYEIKDSVYRLKGFVKAKEGIFFIDGTSSSLNIEPSNFKEDGGIVVLYSDSKELKEFIEKFSKNIII